MAGEIGEVVRAVPESAAIVFAAAGRHGGARA